MNERLKSWLTDPYVWALGACVVGGLALIYSIDSENYSEFDEIERRRKAFPLDQDPFERLTQEEMDNLYTFEEDEE